MKIHYVLLLVLVIVSCNSNQQKSYSSDKEISPITTSQDSLPEGWYNEKLVPYTGKDKAEKNLISQVSTYNKAVLRGDIDDASLYILILLNIAENITPNYLIVRLYKPFIKTFQTCITLYNLPIIKRELTLTS